MRRLRLLVSLGVIAVLGSAPVMGPSATATAQPATDDIAYTMLGRGYAAIFGYPADEVPGRDEEEEEEEAEEPAEKPPNQTCPKGQRGVSEALQKRIDELTDTSDVEPMKQAESETPSPRGQPIKFDFGLADTSLRSDPGSHSIASFFYVDLGGAQDPWTSAETDGYASGHVRMQERCAQPYRRKPGDADDVHVISRTTQGPYAYAFNQTQKPQFPGGVSMKESITVSEMDGRKAKVRGKVASIAKGVNVGVVHADHVVSVVEYTTDGSEAGTTVKAFVDVAGLKVADTPLKVRSGAPPVDIAGTVVGVAAPEVRRRPNGTVEVTVGGLYVGGDFSNPLGAQSKQAVFIGGVWYDASASSFPSFDSSFDFPADDSAATSGLSGGGPPVGSVPAPPADPAPAAPPGAPLSAGVPEASADPAPQAAPPVAVAATTRLGVYRAPPHIVAPLLVLITLLASMGTGSFIWARHRYPEIRGVLGLPLFRWLDYGYRAFMRG